MKDEVGEEEEEEDLKGVRGGGALLDDMAIRSLETWVSWINNT